MTTSGVERETAKNGPKKGRPSQAAAPRPPFLRDLRRALHHLYDPAALASSPLMPLLVAGQPSPSALRQALIDAVEALKPTARASAESDAWRTYRTLSHRYVEQFSQAETAAGLGLSIRQYRRQQDLALQSLADYLWSRYDLQAAEGEGPASPQAEADAPAVLAGLAAREQELDRWARSLPSQPVAVAEAVQSALSIFAPLAQGSAVRMQVTVPDRLPPVFVQPGTLRQALLNVLMAALHALPAGLLRLWAEAHGSEVWLGVTPTAAGFATPALPAESSENLEMARQLAALFGARLEVATGRDPASPFAATFVVPALEQAMVLVVDDNEDALELYRRYLAGSRYAFTGTSSPAEALALVERLPVHAILLDVMLPGIDGWDLLGRLYEHPRTRGVPIIVCSILPQERLALALGAAAFLRKPVTRSALLAALDQQPAPPPPTAV